MTSNRLSGRKRKYGFAFDEKLEDYPNPSKKQRKSIDNDGSRTGIVFDLEKYSAESRESKEILQSMSSIKELSINDISHFKMKIDEKMNEIEQNRQSLVIAL